MNTKSTLSDYLAHVNLLPRRCSRRYEALRASYSIADAYRMLITEVRAGKHGRVAQSRVQRWTS